MYRAIPIASLPHAQSPAGLIHDAENNALVAEAERLHRESSGGYAPQARDLRVDQKWHQVAECPQRPTRLLLTLTMNSGRRYRAAWLWRGKQNRLTGFWERVPYHVAVPSQKTNRRDTA